MNNRIAVSVFLTVLVVFTGVAQLDRTRQPVVGPTPTLRLPAIQRASLPNGLSIMVVEQHALPIVQLRMVVRTGADADPVGKAGVASMAASMLDEGTATRTTLQLADEIDFLGASIGASATFDGSYVTLQTLKEHLPAATDLFADVILHPVFPPSEFDRLRKELLTGLLQEKDDPASVASSVFNRRLYGEYHPYGFELAGTESTVTAFTLDDVRKFYHAYFVPNNATLIAVGDISKDEVLALASKFFGGWERASIPSTALPVPGLLPPTRIYLVDKPNAAQSEIRVGCIGVPRKTDDYFSVSLLNQIIGSPSMLSNRLNLNLREAKGYTYGAYAQFAMRKSAGPFIAAAGVKTAITDSALIEFMKEINRMRDERVPDEEFAMYKASIIQRLPRLFETSGQIAGQLSSVAVYGLPDDYFDSIVQRYTSVTQDDVQKAAKQYFHPDHLFIVIVGDKAQIREKLEKLAYGQVILLDIEGRELAR